MSLDGVSALIRVTGCWLYPLGYTGQDLSIQEGCQLFLLLVTPVLQWTHGCLPSVASLVFEIFFPLMKSLRADLLLIRHQFS